MRTAVPIAGFCDPSCNTHKRSSIDADDMQTASAVHRPNNVIAARCIGNRSDRAQCFMTEESASIDVD